MARFEIYNSLSKRSEYPVTELIGSHIRDIQNLIALEHDPNAPTAMFQVSGVFRSTKTNPKPLKSHEGTNDKGNLSPNIMQWGKNYKNPSKNEKIYDGIGWHTVICSENVIPCLINSGYCLRFHVKEGGNDIEKHFVSTQFIAFDLDKKDSLLSIDETLMKVAEYLIDPFMVHYSPSGSPELPNLRLIVKLSEPSSDRHRVNKLAKRIRAVLPNASPADEVGRYSHGCILPEYSYVNLAASNEIDHLEENLPELKEKTQKLCEDSPENFVDTTDEETRTQARNTLIADEIVRAKFNGNPSQLIDFWIEHINKNEDGDLKSGAWVDRGQQHKSRNSWNGTDPIRGSRTGRGDGFVTSEEHDGRYTYCRDHSKEGGDLIELFYYLKAGSWDVAPPKPSDILKSYKELCKLSGIESPNLFLNVKNKTSDYYQRKLQAVINACVAKNENDGYYFSQKLARSLIYPDHLVHAFFESRQGKLLKYITDKKTDQILFLKHNTKQWRLVGESTVFNSDYADWLRTQIITDPELMGSELPESMQSFKLSEVAKQLHRVEPSFRTTQKPDRDSFWVGFNDGAYNLNTKEFVKGNPELKNCWVAFDWNYLDFADHEGSSILDELTEVGILNTRKEYKEVIRKLAIVTLCGHYQLTGTFSAFVGQSGTMKTTFAKICHAALGKEMAAIEKDQKALEQAIGSHANAMLDDKVLLVLDELLPDEAWLGYFKGIAQGQIEEGIETTINEKGIPREQVTHYYGVFATWNDFIFKGTKIDRDSFLALQRRGLYFKTYKVEGVKKDPKFVLNFLKGDRKQRLIIECLKEFREEYIEHLANMEEHHPDVKTLMDGDLKDDVNKSGDYFFFQDCLIPCEGFAIPGVVLTLAQELYNLRQGNKGKEKTLWDLPRFYSYMESEGISFPKGKDSKVDPIAKWKPLNGTSKDAESVRCLKGMRLTPELEKKWCIEEYITQGTKFSVYSMEVESTLRHMVQNFNSPIYYPASPKAIEVN